MARVFLLLGSNQGDRLKTLSRAKGEIMQRIGELKRESSVYESEPWGFEDETFFLNQLLVVETEMGAEAVLEVALDIENTLGRRRVERHWASRSMDIDILLYDNLIVDKKNLSIPHPRLHLRRFALEPLNEIAGDLEHPVLGKTMSTLLLECKDKLTVTALVDK